MNELLINKYSIGKKESDFLYLVKGFAIFLMIWGHSIQYLGVNDFNFFADWVFKTIYTFHMPLFMAVSGYLFYYSFIKRDLKSLVVHRAKPLIQTLIVCNIFLFFIGKALYGILNGNYKIVFGGKWISSFSDLWFLWSVLCASIGTAIAFKTNLNKFVKILILIAFFVLGVFMPNARENIYMYPFFVGGFLFCKYKNQISNCVFKLKYITILLFPLMVYFKDNYCSMAEQLGTIGSEVATEMYQWVIGFVGIICIVTILKLIFDALYKDEKQIKVFVPFYNSGKKSLEIYCYSTVLLSFWLPKIVQFVDNRMGGGTTFFLTNNIYVYHVMAFIVAIVYVIIIYYFVKLMEKIKLNKILFGK